MKRFWLGRQPALEQRWSFDAQGAIWRIIPLATGQIIGEVRRREEQRVSFFCLEEQSGRLRWSDRELEEPWWLGIEAAAHGVVILHTYEKPDLPQHRDMIALEVESGRELWRLPEVTFWFLTEQHVYAYRRRFEANTVQEFSLLTGELSRSFEEDSEEVAAIYQSAQESLQTGNILLPIPSPVGEDPAVDRLLERSGLPPEGVAGVESLRLDDYLLVSYYVPGTGDRRETVFQNHFRVLDVRTDTLIHQEVLARSVPAPVPDTFYVREGVVISVKELTLLQALQLPEGS